ncbi:MAG TPA: DUF1508 domain-containing protein [Candidatus Limiplasma sp.]|nr:DUF1508 domain-containing protein [Candidatus Limiplasma sp.]HRX08599.1 DUF1508 domain-containing protein [Candidatus Limiplasma sp.]
MYFEIVDSNDDQFFFRIKSASGQTLCHSETYTRKENAKNAINIIKDNAANAEVRDRTESK